MKFGTPSKALACTLPLALVTGCSFFTPAPSAPSAVRPAPPPAVITRDGLAPITEAQVERIREALDAKPSTPAIGNVLRSASPTIESFVRTEGCITARNGTVLGPFAAPSTLFDGKGFQGGPMAEMQFHDKTACATVQRMQNWKMVTPKLLRFEIVYVGDDGEERAVKRHELTRQPKGGWLFTR
ncbi:hypothetical protein VLK31_05175 [Variovorax sp. H27-G14]|uniref:hypothetical protein n=1 Tax=Variovorax sp. H27-G14 TaxID=3111914 RepID=UPI0038FCF313